MEAGTFTAFDRTSQPDLEEGTVVVAEDDPSVSELLVLNLGLAGFSAHAARDGAGALDLCRRHRPELVLLDRSMPVLDGDATCAALRFAGSEAVIVLLTADTSAEGRRRSLDAGADAQISKPFDPAVVIDTLRALVAARRAGLLRIEAARRTRFSERT